MSDVNPYYGELINRAFDPKGGNEFSVVLSFLIVYSSAKFFLADASLTN